MAKADIRWLQRFDNFGRAFLLLRDALDDGGYQKLNQLEQEGAIQRFEYTWELAWKTMKDYLEYSGVVIPSPAGPRNVIKESAQRFFAAADVDGNTVLEMIDVRNQLSHTYDFDKFRTALAKIEEEYLPQLENLYLYFLDEAVTSHA